MSFNFHKMFDMFIRFCDPTIAALKSFATRWGVRKSWGQPQFTMAVSKSWSSTAGWFGVPMSRNFHFTVGFPTWEWIPLHRNSVHFHVFPTSQPQIYTARFTLSHSQPYWLDEAMACCGTVKPWSPEPKKNNHPANIILAFWNLYHPQHWLAINGQTLVCSPNSPCQ